MLQPLWLINSPRRYQPPRSPNRLPAQLRVTHRSLFDNTLQGIARTDRPAFSFQGHPEASPGPHDAAPLFDHFIALMSGQAGGAHATQKG